MNTFSEITEKAQAEIADAFYESAKVNAAASNGLLVPYAPDFERFPYQSISIREDRRYVKGHPLTPQKTFEVAKIIDRRCEGLEDAIENLDSSGGQVSSMQYALESGQNVIGGTDHLELVDIAYLAGGMSAIFRKRNVKHRSAIVLSKAASDYLGVDLNSFGLPIETVKEYLSDIGLEALEDDTVPVRNFLKIAVDLQYLVVPNTPSFDDLRGLQEEAVGQHNEKVKRDIASALSRKGFRYRPPLALFIAMPGTKTKPLNLDEYWQNLQVPGFHETIPEHIPTSETDIHIIGKIADGISDYAGSALSFPTIIRLEEDKEPVIKIDSDYETLNGEERIFNFASKLIKLVDSTDGTTTVYDKKGNLPIKKS